jgi:UDP-N-acetylmuramoyl-L-alanyl-D-glutamate--2,6-diaminopimelate ligase
MENGPDWGHPIRLRQWLPEAELIGADDLCVASCACDSREVRPGDLFAALPGTTRDGHEFVVEAVGRGAAAVLAERRVAGVNLPFCLVPDARNAYGRVCQALAGNPSRDLRVVGITGTNGKTTTSHLVAGVLASAGYPVGVLGTLGAFDGTDAWPSSMTTPPAHELARWLGRTRANGCTHAVLEVSSHGLAQSRLAGIELDAACITNVRRDHLDYHGSIHDYRMTKCRLLEYLTGEGFAVINADDPISAAHLAQIGSPALTVAMRSAAEITAEIVERYLSEQTFLLTAGSETIPVRTRMIGTHHVYNCLVAAAVGLAYGIDLATVVRGLESVTAVPGRLERIECGQPFGVFVDFAHTPDALAGSLRALAAVVEGRLFCVFGAGGDRDKHKRPLMGRAVESAADVAVITSDNPRSEDPNAIVADVLRGFREPERVRTIADRGEAIRWALSAALPGDCVLIAGKGHETCQIIGENPIPFDDREVARDWLYRALPAAA